MALSVKRAAMIGIVSVVAVATAYLPPAPPDINSRDRYSRTFYLDGRLRGEMGILQLLQHRDHAIDAMARQPRAALPLWIDPSIPAVWQQRLRAAAESVWRAAGIDRPLVRVAAAIVTDSIQASGRWQYLVPMKAGDACIVVMTISPKLDWRTPSRSKLIQRHMGDLPGPCAYYAAYGLPGTPMRQWLSGGGAQFALERGPERMHVVAAPPSTPDDVIRSFLDGPAGGYGGLACRRGEAERCAALVATAARQTRPDWIERRLTAWIFPGDMTISDAASRWAADLEQEFGRARFGKFWQSDQPLEAAFAQAFGTPLGAWTTRWVARYPQRDYRVPTTASVLITVLLVTALIGTSALLGLRRQVVA